MRKILLSTALIASIFGGVSSADTMMNPYVSVANVRTDAGTVNQLVSALADQLTQNKDFGNVRKSNIAITSFVSLEDLKETSKFGNIVSENLIHEMQVRGYKVIDFKTMESLQIDEKGDFLFSRDITQLRQTLQIDYALTGTYTDYAKGTVINARIIELNSHVVLSTAQVFVPKRYIRHITGEKNKILDFKPNTISLSK